MKYTAIQYCVVEVFLPDKHQHTNLAWEIGQLIPSYDFDTVRRLVILGDTKRRRQLSISAWLHSQFGLTLFYLFCYRKIQIYITCFKRLTAAPRIPTRWTPQWLISDWIRLSSFVFCQPHITHTSHQHKCFLEMKWGKGSLHSSSSP